MGSPLQDSPRPRGGSFARLDFLDALRGLAALWVVPYHTILIPSPPLETPPWAALARVGGMGVTLFFVVSAFSLCHTLPLHRDDRPLIAFYLRRLFRIAPLFYTLMVLTYVRDAVLFGVRHGPLEILASGTFVFNLIPGWQEGFVWASWTIGVEMLFYLLFPFLHQLSLRLWKALALVVAALLLSALAEHQLGPSAAGQAYFHNTVLRHLPTFAMGMAAYRASVHLLQARHRRWIGAGLVAASGAMLWALLREVHPVLSPYQWQGVIFSLLLVGLSACPVRLLVNPLTTFLGPISYSLYLFHPPLIHLLTRTYRAIYAMGWSLSLRFSLAIGLTLAVLVPLALLAFRYVETPGMRAGKRALAALRDSARARQARLAAPGSG